MSWARSSVLQVPLADGHHWPYKTAAVERAHKKCPRSAFRRTRPLNVMSCCVEDASPIAEEGRRALARIRRDPLSIWWQRRKVHVRSGVSASPFPPRWSQTHGGMQSSVPHTAHDSDTDASSIFSTASQNARHQWDENGFCRKHPRTRLAVKNRRRQMKSSRLKRMFKAGKSDGENEWTVVLPRCPDCEREEEELNTLRMDNSSPVIFTPPTYVPIPAMLDIINAHSMLPEDTLAIQVRSAPMPCEEISLTGDWCWDTPSSGALDFLVPVDKEGNELAAITCIGDGPDGGNAPAGEYEYIMERIIPISCKSIRILRVPLARCSTYTHGTHT